MKKLRFLINSRFDDKIANLMKKITDLTKIITDLTKNRQFDEKNPPICGDFPPFCGKGVTKYYPPICGVRQIRGRHLRGFTVNWNFDIFSSKLNNSCHIGWNNFSTNKGLVCELCLLRHIYKLWSDQIFLWFK